MERFLKEVQFLKGVGPKRNICLNNLGIRNIFDMLWYVPRSYFNWDKISIIADLKAGDNAAIRGTIKSIQAERSRRGMSIIKATLQDQSGIITAVWFNQPHITAVLKTGQEVLVNGRIKINRELEIHVIQYHLANEEYLENKIVPIYPLTEGLNQKLLRNIVLNILSDYLPYYQEIVAESIRAKYDLCDIKYAFRNIHFPQNREAYIKARKRLALEELLLFQFKIRQEEQSISDSTKGIVHKDKTNLVKKVLGNLPFKLTNAQYRVINDIFRDMESTSQMNRLLQGDVGSGKTIVAALAMAKSIAGGFQTVLMAPTEILAQQHYKTIKRFFRNSRVKIICLTGDTSAPDREMIAGGLISGEIDLVIGTHALIEKNVRFKNLGLVIIDEQQRFGVKQREKLGQKGIIPDILVMTATPIPRTLALTVYGNLSLSIIDELPPGRKRVKTVYVNQTDRESVYNFIHKLVHRDKVQVYIVCPLIDESEKLDLQAAITLYEKLRNGIFSDLSLGLIHGRMKSEEKDYIMNRFKKQAIKILVATSIIEVGVDVPEAVIMVIEQAERFGLSQLHQLRGRVGRGRTQSYCFLIGNPTTEEAYRRLQAMQKSNDGFKLAEEDLLIRGPGDFWGIKQHGLNELKLANLLKDQDLTELSQTLCRIIPYEENNLGKYISMKFRKLDSIARN
jgi:ATP-dependent DNA helicase RecG